MEVKICALLTIVLGKGSGQLHAPAAFLPVKSPW